MFKRIFIYLNEMFPIISRLFVSIGLFYIVYFLVIITSDISSINIGVQEVVGSLTVFGFLLVLRIADEFKDYETDKINFPKRPLPSGRVKKKDLRILAVADIVFLVTTNVFFMNNIVYFAILMAYAALMTVWFFAKKYIQPNLLLALITHNPVQFLLLLYIISFTSIQYFVPVFTATNLLIAAALYVPALAWEISRKIRAPKKEDQYMTYYRIFGYKNSAVIVLAILGVQIACFVALFQDILPEVIVAISIAYIGLLFASMVYIHKPNTFVYGTAVRAYLYIVQTLLIIAELYILLSR